MASPVGTPQPDLAKLIRETDLARVLGYTPNGIRYQSRIGKLPPFQRVFGKVWYVRTEVERYLKKQGKSL